MNGSACSPDAGAAAVITTASLCSWADSYGAAVVDIEDEGIAAQPGTPLPVPAPDDIAICHLHLGHHGHPEVGGGSAL